MITKQVVFFTGYSLLPKKYVLSFNELGIIQQHMTFTGFKDSK